MPNAALYMIPISMENIANRSMLPSSMKIVPIFYMLSIVIFIVLI